VYAEADTFRSSIFSGDPPVAIYKLIANGSFGPDEIEVMKAAYEAALVDVGVTNPDDPITELIAKSIVNVTASGVRDPTQVMERALNALGVRRSAALSGIEICGPERPLPQQSSAGSLPPEERQLASGGKGRRPGSPS
jgi:hypothetical protein